MPVILLTVFIDLLGFGLIVPTLPFLTLRYGGTAFDGTALMSIYSIMAFASGPLWGRFSDRFGRRPALIATLFGAVISYIALAFSDSLAMLYVARALSGLMAGNIGIVMAIAADLSDEQNRGKAMGQIGAMFGLGFAFGPFIGGFLGSTGGEPSILLPGLTAAGLSFLAMCLSYYFVPETNQNKDDSHAEAGGKAPHWSQVLASPAQLMLLAIFMITGIAQSASFSITPFWADVMLSWNEKDVGFLYAGVGIVMVCVQWSLIGPLFKKLGEAKALAVAAAIHVAGTILVVFAHNFKIPMLVGMMMVLTALTIAFPALNSMMSRRSDRRLQGTALGLSNGVSALGRVLGPLFAGGLFSALHPSWPFVLVGAAGFVVLLWALDDARRSALLSLFRTPPSGSGPSLCSASRPYRPRCCSLPG